MIHNISFIPRRDQGSSHYNSYTNDWNMHVNLGMACTLFSFSSWLALP
ncbi:Na_H_Exchanger domain-containing protein [Psidium guajava]|nr:Na_H_Exchanger domain-containing protein [Psidium guajava]